MQFIYLNKFFLIEIKIDFRNKLRNNE
jgi:hypothetical protein